MSELHHAARNFAGTERAEWQAPARVIRELLAENERLVESVSKLDARPVGPERCPFTGREFWGNITHPEIGEVATYGGPFDTYTLPQRTDDDPDYTVRRFDHDRGHWLLEEVECIGQKLFDDQLYTSEDDPAELRARAEAAEAACENLGVTPQQAAEGLARFKAREARIAELEARYAALCEAEPVAWAYKMEGDLQWQYTPNQQIAIGLVVPLIPRPSMEGKP